MRTITLFITILISQVTFSQQVTNHYAREKRKNKSIHQTF